jgi:hypothetical protein
MVLRVCVIAGLVGMLTLILLWSAVSAPQAAITSAEMRPPTIPTASPTTAPTQASLPPLTLQPAPPTLVNRDAPTATAAPAAAGDSVAVAEEPAPVEPEAEPDAMEVESESPEPDQSAIEAPATDPAAPEGEAEPVDKSERQELAYAPELDANWESAIQTPGGGLVGSVLATVNVRSAPSIDAPVVVETYAGHLVVVYGVTAGDWVVESDVWYVVGPDEYVAAEFVAPFVPAPPESTWEGAWVDVNLSTGYAVAYVDATPVYAAITMVGKPGFETPVGAFTIFERVASETLDSASVGIPEGDPEYYYIEDVSFTQYFAEGGFALHANYWDPAWLFGSASSHGCVNLIQRDAAWFWDFLDLGSVVSIHY